MSYVKEEQEIISKFREFCYNNNTDSGELQKVLEIMQKYNEKERGAMG